MIYNWPQWTMVLVLHRNTINRIWRCLFKVPCCAINLHVEMNIKHVVHTIILLSWQPNGIIDFCLLKKQSNIYISVVTWPVPSINCVGVKWSEEFLRYCTCYYCFMVLQVNSVILVMTVVSMVRGRIHGGAEQGIKTRELVKWVTLIFTKNRKH